MLLLPEVVFFFVRDKVFFSVHALADRFTPYVYIEHIF